MKTDKMSQVIIKISTLIATVSGSVLVAECLRLGEFSDAVALGMLVALVDATTIRYLTIVN